MSRVQPVDAYHMGVTCESPRACTSHLAFLPARDGLYMRNLFYSMTRVKITV